MTTIPATETALNLAAGTWTADTSHSTVQFSVRHIGIAKVRGQFDDFTTTLTVGETLDTITVDTEINLASINTGNADRDGHLQSGDFLTVEQNPTARFVSTSISSNGPTYVLSGDLTLNGITREVVLDVEFLGREVLPLDNSTRIGFEATAELSRKDFGIDFNAPIGADRVLISDTVKLQFDIELVAVQS